MRTLYDILIIICLSISLTVNLIQYHAYHYMSDIFIDQCGTSKIITNVDKLNNMFDALEEGGEK